MTVFYPAVGQRRTLTAAQTRFTFTGLNGDRDIAYEFAIFGVDGAASTNSVGIEFNGDTTASNYDHTYHGVVPASTVAAGSANTNVLGNLRSGAAGIITGTFFCRQGLPRPYQSVSIEPQTASTSPVILLVGGQWRTTNTNIVSVSFVASNASGFGAGTTFLIKPAFQGI